MIAIPDYRERREGFCFLVGLGVQKAGTGWLDSYFRSHPEVHMPSTKEMNYFNSRGDAHPAGIAEKRRQTLRDLQRSPRLHWRMWKDYAVSRLSRGALPAHSPPYLRRLVAMHDAAGSGHGAYWSLLMRGYRGQPCAADITPQYAMLPEAALAEIAGDFPAARFLLVLRDPVQRSWSHLRMIHRRRSREVPGTPPFETFLDGFLAGAERIVLRYSDYADVLQRVEAAVPPQRLLVLFYEELFSDGAIARMCAFAGVGFLPGNYAQVVHQGPRAATIRPDVEACLRRELAPAYRAVAARFADRVPPAWMRPEGV